MHKVHLTRLCALFTLLLCTTIAAADPATWQASDKDNDIWLFASISYLGEDTAWKTRALDNALQSAHVFYYETPTDDNAHAEIAKLVAARGMNPEGQPLTDQLTQDQTELLARVTTWLGIPLNALQPRKAWLASASLTGPYTLKSGYIPDGGVMRRLQLLTPDSQERFFETPANQIGFFTGLSDEAAVAWLVASLHQIEDQPKLPRKIFSAWESGDTETINTLLDDEFQRLEPEFYQALIVNRNEAWAREIVALMADDEDALITVDVLHMLGKDGLLAELEAQGLTTERVQ